MASKDNAIVSQPQPVATVTIKQLEPSEAQFSGNLRVQAFLSTYEHAVGKHNISKITDGFVNEIDTRPPSGFSHNYVAWYQGEPAGYMLLRYHGPKQPSGENPYSRLGCSSRMGLCFLDMLSYVNVDEGSCYLDTVCVDAKFRGKGIGKALLDFADNDARTRGCRRIYLYVTGINRAKNLYARQGYVITDTTTSCVANCAAGTDTFHEMVKEL